MSEPSPIWISEAEVVSLMDMGGAIGALERGLLSEARGTAANMVKTHVAWDDGSTLHAIGAVFPNEGFAGTKTWAHTAGGAAPLLILFDSRTGALKAIVEAFALGQLRTASAAGVATNLLAAKDADDFAIVGTGKQAISQVAAVLAVRPIRRARVFGRNEERRANFVERVKKELGVEAMACRDIAETVEGASIITTVTRAIEPIINAAMIARGAHINAIGAIVPTHVEVARDVLERCSQIVVDSLPQARKLSRELIDFFGMPDQEGWKQVKSLAEVVAAGEPRHPSDDLTMFKSLGMGISDVSLGMELYRKARAQGLGREFAHPGRATPILHSAQPVSH